MPFHIDLKKLTMSHFREAEASEPSGCSYSDPCIIGTLIPKEDRGKYAGAVHGLVDDGFFTVDDDQRLDVVHLQQAFDCRSIRPEAYAIERRKICEKYNIT